MTDHMDRCVEQALEEMVGGVKPPPVDIERIKARAFGGELEPDMSDEAGSEDRADAKIATLPRERNWGVAAAVACVVVGFGLIALSGIEGRGPSGNGNSPLVRDGNPLGEPLKLPPSVYVFENVASEYTISASHIELKQGLFLISEGETPEIHAGHGRVGMVKGRALLWAGHDAPEGDSRRALVETLLEERKINEEEAEIMSTKNWIVRAGMALCLVSGSVMVNGEQVFADEGEGHDEIAGWFNKVDANKDGKITQDEAEAKTSLGTALPQWKDMDANKDGSVTLQELRDYCAAAAKKREADEKRREKEAEENREGEREEAGDEEEDEEEDDEDEGDDD
ncbi:MAG: EF-hand domain-containing protein [Planctomycetaceae bacterium]|nr:EF-hand domain-containing protein [Planctomycetaceae bacterium]